VDDQYATANGALANKVQFFGSNTAETTSITGESWMNSWNGDRLLSARSVNPWLITSGTSSYGTTSGVFATSYNSGAGGTEAVLSHRTILSGY
jgi:hypothetical protein